MPTPQPTVLQREPLTLSAGDELVFQRFLADYLPSNGWTLSYDVKGGPGGSGGAPAISFNTTADSTGTYYLVDVAAAATAAWPSGSYVMTGYVTLTATGERHQVYYNEFLISPNFASPTNDVDVRTHSQKMIALLEAALEANATSYIHASTVQQSTFIREKRMELEKQLGYNKELRANEIALENVRNGQPSGNRIIPQFRIVSPPTVIGSVTYPFPN